MKRSYNYFRNVCNNLPWYLQKNLNNMPNNKGYIYKDVHFYGELESENNNKITLFEKQKDKLLIHEWINKDYYLYEKKINEKKKLILKKIKKLKN